LPATVFSLLFVNASANVGDVCVFQNDLDLGAPGVMPVAWFTKRAFPGTEVLFQWTVSYNFVWAETGRLASGIVFAAAQRPEADLQTTNRIDLEHLGAFNFVNQRSGTGAGILQIDATGQIPFETGSTGIGMAGGAIYLAQAQPNQSHTFRPHPSYWITFGAFMKGQVLNPAAITVKQEIRFDPGVVALTATLQRDNLWKVTRDSG